MKFQLLIILSILSVLIIPVYGQTDNIQLTTDKTEYLKGEIVYVNGTVLEVKDDWKVDITVFNPESSPMIIGSFEVNSDGIFNVEIELEGERWKSNGDYSVFAYYAGISTEIPFKIIPSNIESQVDKEEYYLNENIFINGTMTDVNWLNDTSIIYDVYDLDGTVIESGDGGILQNDGSFNFAINNIQWIDSDDMKITISIQDFAGSAYFYYNNTPNMANESLYDMIIINLNLQLT